MDLTARRRRLLFLVPFPPRLRGRHGGATVTGQLIAGLARRHDVAVLYLTEAGEPSVEGELRDACDLLEGVTRRGPPTGLPARLIPKVALLRRTPTWASELAEPSFASRVEELAGRWRPDVVQIEYPVMGQYLPALNRCAAPRVLVDHEASARDLRRWEGPLAPVIKALERRAWRSYERRMIEGVDSVVVFTERDRRALERLGTRTPIAVIPFGMTAPEPALNPAGTAPLSVLFVGNSTHPPNADAAHWLATRLFPPLRASCPGVVLTIVGASPPPELMSSAGEDVVVTGEVADVNPYLDAAAVVAAPIRVGGGMRVKVLEALAAGKAVVGTPLAVEGLEVTPGDQLEIAGTSRRSLMRCGDCSPTRDAEGASASARGSGRDSTSIGTSLSGGTRLCTPR